MLEYLLDDYRVFHAGNDLDRAFAFLTGFNVDMAYRDIGQGREQERKL